MKLSNYLNLNTLDFLKGLFLAVLTAVLTAVYDSLQLGSLAFDWKKIGIVATTSAVAYLLNRLVSNSEGKLFKSEKIGIGGGIKNPKKP